MKNKYIIKKYFKLLASGKGGLKIKVIRGGFWVFSLRIFRGCFELIRTIVLARLLTPGDLGLMGIALLAMSALENFSMTGIDQAIIQTNDDSKEYLNTAWTIQVLRGLAIASILYFGAPVVGTFFGENSAVPLTRALALSEVCKAFTHVGIVFFQKELKFQKQFIFQMSGTIADLLVSILAAIILHSPWALIYGLLAGNITRLILSFIVTSYPLSFSINKKYVKSLLNYGKYIFIQSILLFLMNQGDDAFVGRYLGVAALGIYQLGYRVSNIVTTEFTHVISTVTFPAFSKIQDNHDKLKKAFQTTLDLTSIITFPIAGGIFILAPEFTHLFLGEQWVGVIPIIQILTIEGLMRSIAASYGSIYQATANLKVPLKIAVVQSIVLSIIIYPFSAKWGIQGTAVAVTIMIAVGLFMGTIKTSNFLNIKVSNLLNKNMIRSLCFSLLMMLIIYILKKSLFISSSYISFMLLILIGIGSYVIFYLSYYLLSKKSKSIYFS